MIEYTVKVWGNGSESWYLNGKLHREDGPAREYASGDKFWYLNGKLHREDGPAVEWPNNGTKYWYLNDKEVTKEEHKRMTSPVVEMTSVEMTMEEINKALGKQVKVVE